MRSTKRWPTHRAAETSMLPSCRKTNGGGCWKRTVEEVHHKEHSYLPMSMWTKKRGGPRLFNRCNILSPLDIRERFATARRYDGKPVKVLSENVATEEAKAYEAPGGAGRVGHTDDDTRRTPRTTKRSSGRHTGGGKCSPCTC